MKSRLWLLAAGLAVALASFGIALAADPPKPAEENVLIIVDSADKEHKVKQWEITTGVRHLSWLAAPAPAADKDAPKKVEKAGAKGPEALEFREDNSTTYKDGVLTLVPLDRIRAIDYEDMDIATITVAGDKPEDDVKLKGPTKYQGINKLAIKADVDKGELGTAELKFQGGVNKGIKSVRFPAPKGAAAPAGRTATITLVGKEQGDKPAEPLKVTDLQALYRLGDGSEVLAPTLMFRKTLKIDIGKVQKLRATEGSDRDGKEFGVTLKDGAEEIFTLLRVAPLETGKPAATLLGFLGKVPAGYKLFPLGIVSEVQFE